MEELIISGNTGRYSYQIINWLLREEYKLTNIYSDAKCRLDELLRLNNRNRYLFNIGEKINIYTEKEVDIFITYNAYPHSRVGIDPRKLSKGWRLFVQDGKGLLVQGYTGWLIDENGLYILKDGRRVEEKDIRINGDDLRIGDEDPIIGFKKMFGDNIILRDEYETESLLMHCINGELSINNDNHDVVFQALQINACYVNEELIINNNVFIKKIGTDEQDIPIVVTQVGNDEATKKLVIAGPHGDERNAQRLIMQTQRHFIHHGAPENTVLYFIPCTRPTMCFADARGISINFFGGSLGTPMRRSIYYLNPDLNNFLTIPALHDKMLNTLRSDIQSQENPKEPEYGIDANRDVTLSLPSSRAFADFVKSLTGFDIRFPALNSYKGDCTFFFIHGYDSTKAIPDSTNTSPQGCVYGQYKVTGNNTFTIEPTIKKYIDFMTQSLFGYINSESDKNNNNAYMFDINMNKYQGEWIRQLYGETRIPGIIAFDIELGQAYNEGVRNTNYNYNKIGSNTLPFYKDLSGFLVDTSLRRTRNINDLIIPTISFFDFILNFYNYKEQIDVRN